jgi:hypothetical protein
MAVVNVAFSFPVSYNTAVLTSREVWPIMSKAVTHSAFKNEERHRRKNGFAFCCRKDNSH